MVIEPRIGEEARLAEIVRWLVEAYQSERICTHSYFEARRRLKASLPGPILRDGRLLHVA